MGLFTRDKKDKKKTESGAAPASDIAESSPQKVGIVSGVLSTTAESAEEGDSKISDVVARRFGPGAAKPADEAKLPPQYEAGELHSDSNGEPTLETSQEPAPAADESSPIHVEKASDPPRRDHLRAVEALKTDSQDIPELEVDPMAHIGRTTIITGDVVAEEDLEIQGTIEGSVRLANHQVSVGLEGHVKASVEAHTVHVTGRITGDVVAAELVEVEAGGIIGGDVKAPRIIMHDGAIVVGGLDMSAALPNAGAKKDSTGMMADEPARPILKKVEAPSAEKTDKGSA